MVFEFRGAALLIMQAIVDSVYDQCDIGTQLAMRAAGICLPKAVSADFNAFDLAVSACICGDIRTLRYVSHMRRGVAWPEALCASVASGARDPEVIRFVVSRMEPGAKQAAINFACSLGDATVLRELQRAAQN